MHFKDKTEFSWIRSAISDYFLRQISWIYKIILLYVIEYTVVYARTMSIYKCFVLFLHTHKHIL